MYYFSVILGTSSLVNFSRTCDSDLASLNFVHLVLVQVLRIAGQTLTVANLEQLE